MKTIRLTLFWAFMVVGTFLSKGVVIDNLEFSTNEADNTAKLVRAKDLSVTEVVIPETINVDGKVYDVITIKNGAFSRCSDLKEVTIPRYVAVIEPGAFGGCDEVETLYYNAVDCVKCVEIMKFSYDQGKDGVWVETEIYTGMPTTIKNLVIGDEVEYIPEYAFYNCSMLTSVSMGESIISIGEYAFSDCLSLTSITIPPQCKIY